MKFSPRIGTAGWSIPKTQAEAFPLEGSHLQRYSAVLNGVEINSSFYCEHQEKTYRRWAQDTPQNFRFSVKLSKVFTHEQRLDVEKSDLKEVIAPILAVFLRTCGLCILEMSLSNPGISLGLLQAPCECSWISQ